MNGTERKVTFTSKDGTELEIVQSLAKWKRYALGKYGLNGLYTDMNAIRVDEITDNIHSIYVDQWDWEAVIRKDMRDIDTLIMFVNKVFRCIKDIDIKLSFKHPNRKELLQGVANIHFIQLSELHKRYPGIEDQHELERLIAREHKAVFIIGISEQRAPDYDDWTLNGDIIVWNPVLNDSLELSSMGIRVDKESMLKQLKIKGCEDRCQLMYHRMIINEQLPYTIGGGIGQSRLCMWLLQLPHISQVQCSYWGSNEIANVL